MKRFALLLMLPGIALAQAYFGSLPATYDHSFYVLVDTDVVMCKADGTNCGASKRFTASTAAAPGWHNCNLEVPKPAGADATYLCVAATVAPPAVTPPVPAPVPVALQPCWVADPFAYHFDSVPTSASVYYTNAVTWVSDCAGKVEVVLYNTAEFTAAVAAVGNSKSKDNFNAYAKTQPARFWTAGESAYAAILKAKYTPAPVAAPVLVVQRQSATVVGDRPVYKITASGTLGSAMTVVRAPGLAPCDSSKRIGTTAYYFVPSVNGYAACAAQ